MKNFAEKFLKSPDEWITRYTSDRAVRSNNSTFVFEGKTPLKDFYKAIKILDIKPFENAKGEAETLAGFLLEITMGFPKKNEIITFHNYSFTIEAFENKRIKQIKISIKP